MEDIKLSPELIDSFRAHLESDEKSRITIEKYMRDLRAFAAYAMDEPLSKTLTLGYKAALIRQGYAERSINSMLAALSSFLDFCGRADCKVKSIKMQRQIYSSEKKELSKEEYLRLLNAAKRKPRLHLLLETICSTGIRVSELRFFTVEAVSSGDIDVRCKGKSRRIIIPEKLKKLLLAYAKRTSVSSGVIFRTRNGLPIDRSNIWAEMKKLCSAARVCPEKVFPHNLSKLFARTFYRIGKDIAKLADILGHSSIETTRIYIMSTGLEHRKKIESLGLVL